MENIRKIRQCVFFIHFVIMDAEDDKSFDQENNPSMYFNSIKYSQQVLNPSKAGS